jgi:hypothetical protein
MKRERVRQGPCGLSVVTALLVTLGTLAACARPADKAATQTGLTQAPATRAAADDATVTAGPPAGVATFATAEAAVDALIAAGEKQDNAALAALLGSATDQLLSSGDPVADRRARDAFLARYRAYHELVAGSPDQLVLLAGEDRWPFPIPLVRTNGRWWWDGASGARELVTRRIGADELHTIDVMKGFVAAENDYAAGAHDGGPPGVFAARLRSSPGKQDGLFWEVAPGELPSPAGPFLAAADAEGYAVTGQLDRPYHGYLFKILTSQGGDANGGARSYLSDGRLTGGYALLAYPASYGSSGIMTFMVNQDGVVWQRDFGRDTAALAAAITQFDPDEHWTPLAPEG